jgi:pimeloyl-ACP methyl ester carboxylesterase
MLSANRGGGASNPPPPADDADDDTDTDDGEEVTAVQAYTQKPWFQRFQDAVLPAAFTADVPTLPCIKTEDGDVAGDPVRMASLILCMWSYEAVNTAAEQFKRYTPAVSTAPAPEDGHYNTLTVHNLGVVGSEQFHLEFRDFRFQADWAVSADVTKLPDLTRAGTGPTGETTLGTFLAFRGTKPKAEMVTWPAIGMGYVHSQVAKRVDIAKRWQIRPAIVTGHSLGANVAFQYLYWQFGTHEGAGLPASSLGRVIVFNPAASYLDGTNDDRQQAMGGNRMLTNSEVHYADSDPILASTSEQGGILRALFGREKSHRYRAARFKTFIHLIKDNGLLSGHGLLSFVEQEHKIYTPLAKLGNAFTDMAVL